MTKQNEVKVFNVPSTGKVVHIKATGISPAMLAMDLMTNDPYKPRPALQVVNLAGKEVVERNYSDPSYISACEKWERDIELKAGRIMLENRAVVNLTEDDKAEVKLLREDNPGIPQNQSDKMLWLKYIAIGCDEDLTALMQFIRGSSEPTEEGVNKTSESFQGNA